MKKKLRFVLLCLLLPVMMALFYLESTMELSASEHTLMQILILIGIYWLVWRWIQFDEFSKLREGVHRDRPAIAANNAPEQELAKV